MYLGIDPGNDGAFALINGEGDVLALEDMPIVKIGSRKTIDEASLLATLRPLATGAGKVALEKVNGIPGQSAPAAFNFGCGWGLVRGILATLLVPYELITPQRWKKLLMEGQPKDKGASRVVARRLFPRAADRMTLVKHHGRADALLLAEYARRRL